MRKYLIIASLMAAILTEVGCSPIEKQAYETIVAAKAFLDKEKSVHPECASGSQSALCVDLSRATSAKDALIDAAEVYCSGAQFEAGGPCQPPAKGTPAAQQAADKLKAAIAAYNQAATDLKGAAQ